MPFNFSVLRNYQCERRKLKEMAETVPGSHHQRMHHMLSESAWDRAGVRRQLIEDANTHFGYASARVIDESAFAKRSVKFHFPEEAGRH